MTVTLAQLIWTYSSQEGPPAHGTGRSVRHPAALPQAVPNQIVTQRGLSVRHLDVLRTALCARVAEQSELADRGVLVGDLHERCDSKVRLPALRVVPQRGRALAELGEVDLRTVCDRTGSGLSEKLPKQFPI